MMKIKRTWLHEMNIQINKEGCIILTHPLLLYEMPQRSVPFAYLHVLSRIYGLSNIVLC